MKTLLTLLIVLALAPMTVAAYAAPNVSNGNDKTGPSAKPGLPNVQLPYTFTCPHCNMKITIKTQADWTKDCFMCACGETNLGCYNDSQKKTPAKSAKTSGCCPMK